MYCIEIRSRKLNWHNPFSGEFGTFATEWDALAFIQDNMLLRKWEKFEIRIS